jgi:hypothetical protein
MMSVAGLPSVDRQRLLSPLYLPVSDPDYNSATGESRWTKPEHFQAPQQAGDVPGAQPAPTDAQAPQGFGATTQRAVAQIAISGTRWTEAITPEGRAYYYDLSTLVSIAGVQNTQVQSSVLASQIQADEDY